MTLLTGTNPVLYCRAYCHLNIIDRQTATLLEMQPVLKLY